MNLFFVIPGKPIPLKRARHGNGRTYDSQKSEKLLFQLYLKKQYQRPLLTKPLLLDITFFMPIPESWSRKKKEAAFNTPHHSTPDLSNLIKWVEDCATNVIYQDDALIARIIAYKVYSDEPRTEFTIREIV